MSSDPLRKRPYVWPTWLTKLLAEESKCWYASWVKATRRYKKKEDPDREAFFAEYTAKHDKIVAARAARMKTEGWLVRVEDEGEFKLKGKTADLAGKPDIVGIRDKVALVVDGKSGRPKESDKWQVLVYLFALPLSWLKGDFELRGEVQYTDHVAEVPPLRDFHVEKISGAIRRVSDVTVVPEAVPSARECERCDVASCKARHVAPKPGDARRFF